MQPTLLETWTNFYVIVGSSAGALTGLQFVVIALVAEMRAVGSIHEVRAFGSPTVVHFCAVLFSSAVMAAPWRGVGSAGLGVAFCGGAGVLYTLYSISHALRQTGYKPDAEDWFWYEALPLSAYAALLVVGLLVRVRPDGMLFGVAAILLVLLFTGLHNAWDTVTYVAVSGLRQRREEKR